MISEIDKLLQEIGISTPAEKVGDKYIVEVSNSNVYGAMYTKLDRSDLVEEDSDNSNISFDESRLEYVTTDEKYRLSLIADFDKDVYKLEIKEN